MKGMPNTGPGGAADTEVNDATAAGAGGSAQDSSPRESPGCGTTVGFAAGMHSIKVGGADRIYAVHRPAGYDPTAKKAWPLVLALHPNGSNISYWAPTTGVRALSPLLKDTAILVRPQAINDDWRSDLSADLDYFEALIQEVESNLCVDTTRIFALGHSGGGSFAGVLGCHRSDVRAIAASGAVIYFEEQDCVGQPAAWITIGVDEAIPERVAYRDFFRNFAGCRETSTPVPPDGCVLYDCPSPNRPVEFCSHPGGHEWPSFGSTETVAFFSRFF